jgi:MFS superfamily sulfate permease-like transporter
VVDATLEIYFRRNAVLQAVWIHDAHNGKTIMNEANEKPQNGIGGFKHFRYDILSGLVVSLVSLPLSSGIAIASGAPPVVGLISAIIAGLIFPFIGGAYMTIAGPAAGLAPALLAVMTSLGGAGDAETIGEGYRFLLCVIFLVGIVQILLVALRLAKFSAIIPIAVVEGMLASIGLLIMVKQIPMFLGYTKKPNAREFYEFLLETPTYIQGSNMSVVAVSCATLALLFALSSFQKKVKLLKVVPPQLIGVVFGVILAIALDLKHLDPKFLISLPEKPFSSVMTPDFKGLLSRPDLWYAVIMGVIALTMIDGVESLATAMAVDRIDPYKRRSNPNRLLLAMGICNMISSIFGGLTIIPGGVKSKANIASGGRTLWANFTNAICLLVYLLVARDMIMLIPKGALAGVLIFTGWKMCEPAIWRHFASIGKEQLFVFTATIVATLATDLLWGIIIGTLLTLVFNSVLYRFALVSNVSLKGEMPSYFKTVAWLFSNPITEHEIRSSECRMVLGRPLVCFNSYLFSEELSRIPPEIRKVVIHVGPDTGLVDHTACENLMFEVEENAVPNRAIRVKGLDQMKRLSSSYDRCTHIAVVPQTSVD